MTNAWICAAALAGAVLIASPARAQLMGNAPYQPMAGNIGGMGMSPAYRQVILNSKLLGQQTNPLVRDESGFLLSVDRRNSQAFLRVPNQPFLVGSDGAGIFSADRAGIVGGGLGWGGADGYRAAVYVGSGPYDGNSLYWIGMLNESPNSLPWSGVTSGAAAAVPISAWIAQLNSP